jgi:hypothetical protein
MSYLRLGWITRTIALGFRRDGTPNWPWLSWIIAFGSLQAAFVVVATYLDNSWYLQSPNKGLFQHYGACALLITDPLLLVSASYAYRRFRIALSTLPLCDPERDRSRARAIARPYLEFLHLKGRARYAYLLFVTVGILAWANNIYETANPKIYFKHDVFDSTTFHFGYYVYKTVLFDSWVIIYPIVGFLLLLMCFFIRLILIKLRLRQMICPNVLHPDGSYGLSNLGTLNICLLTPYLLTFTVIFGVIFTHEAAYASLIVPLFVFSILFIVVSFITIKPVLDQAKEIKRLTYKRLVRRSYSRYVDLSEQLAFGIERLSYALSNGSPYSQGGRILLLLMRAGPVVLTTTRFLLS